jgi:hypothetical protein
MCSGGASILRQVTHHVIHRLIRGYIERGSHDIDVVTAGYKPRRYQADCLDCRWKSTVGTGGDADKALIRHRDETVTAAQTSRLRR